MGRPTSQPRARRGRGELRLSGAFTSSSNTGSNDYMASAVSMLVLVLTVALRSFYPQPAS